MTNETRKEFNLIDHIVTETELVTVMQDQTVMEDQVIDDAVVQVPVVIQVPVVEEREVQRVTKIYEEVEVPLTDEEQAAVNAVRADKLHADLIASLPAHRYDVEVGGITVSGIPIATDRYTQVVLIGARVLAKENPDYAVNWKNDDDTFVNLNSKMIIEIANAVASWVQKCFDTEMAISENLDTYTAVDDMIKDFDALMKK